jgi:hypothetical protein
MATATTATTTNRPITQGTKLGTTGTDTRAGPVTVASGTVGDSPGDGPMGLTGDSNNQPLDVDPGDGPMGLTGDSNNQPLDVDPAAVASNATSTEPTRSASNPPMDRHRGTTKGEVLRLIRSSTPLMLREVWFSGNKQRAF